jgi:NDP-sugar pyrophosphorylase family protein
LDVESALRENRWDFDWFEFSNAGEDATMIQRLLKAREGSEGERALICYGDELADVDIPALVKDHERSKAMMTMTSHVERLPFGVFSEGRIIEGKEVSVNIGFAIVEPQAWKYAEGCSGLSDFFNKLTWCVDGMTSVNVYEHHGARATINNPSDIAKAEELFK